MTKAEIISQLRRLSHRDQREIIARILEMEQDAELVAHCDRRADEPFLMLDVMEAEGTLGAV